VVEAIQEAVVEEVLVAEVVAAVEQAVVGDFPFIEEFTQGIDN
tara:strand:- start:343 stop:471 length:129 start_codon:yes stop_codon:yes gene_type:complete